MLGERGGATATVEAGVALIETHKGDLSAAVRADILDHLATSPEWHCDDLRVDLTGNRNVLGAVVIGLVNSGRIVETGRRRRSAEPASHGRKSNVYKLAGRADTSRARKLAGGRESAASDTTSLSGSAGQDLPATGQLFVMPEDRRSRSHYEEEEA